MQLSKFLKVPVIYFFEGFAEFDNIPKDESSTLDLNYSFLSKLFSGLSEDHKLKILSVLKNTRILDKKFG